MYSLANRKRALSPDCCWLSRAWVARSSSQAVSVDDPKQVNPKVGWVVGWLRWAGGWEAHADSERGTVLMDKGSVSMHALRQVEAGNGRETIIVNSTHTFINNLHITYQPTSYEN